VPEPGRDSTAHALLVGGYQTLARLDRDKKVIWSLSTRSGIYDVWQLPNGHVLYNHSWGVFELGAEGKVVWEYGSPDADKKVEEILSCQPLPGGAVLVLEAGKNRLIELDRKKRIEREVPLPSRASNIHDRYTLARKTRQGTYLVSLRADEAIAELDGAGRILWQMPLGLRPWSLVRLSNGHTLVSAFLADKKKPGPSRVFELDRRRKVVWEVTAADLPWLKRFWPTGVHRLPNGNTLILNTDYHVEAEGEDAVQAFELTRDKRVVWRLTAAELGAQLPRATDGRTKLQEYRLLSIQALDDRTPAPALLR
jgi:hypothetical protein